MSVFALASCSDHLLFWNRYIWYWTSSFLLGSSKKQASGYVVIVSVIAYWSSVTILISIHQSFVKGSGMSILCLSQKSGRLLFVKYQLWNHRGCALFKTAGNYRENGRIGKAGVKNSSSRRIMFVNRRFSIFHLLSLDFCNSFTISARIVWFLLYMDKIVCDMLMLLSLFIYLLSAMLLSSYDHIVYEFSVFYPKYLVLFC